MSELHARFITKLVNTKKKKRDTGLGCGWRSLSKEQQLDGQLTYTAM